MQIRGFLSAGVLMTLAGLLSPAFASPPVDQLPATGDESGVLDPSDYGPRGTASYGASRPADAPRAGAVTQSSAKPASSQWELYSQLQQLQEEVQSLRGMVEQQSYELEQLKKQQRDRYLDIDSRLSRLQSSSPAASGGAATASTDGATASSSAEASADVAPKAVNPADASGDEKSAYDAAYDNVSAKKYDVAITRFEAFLVQYPSGALAPNAHYWLGVLYGIKATPDYDKAQGHFQYLLKNYPTHPKAADTLYELGKLNRARGDKARAKAFFDRLIANYPDSPAARKARDLMR